MYFIYFNWIFNGQKYNLTTLPSDLHPQLLTGTHFVSPQAKYVILGQSERVVTVSNSSLSLLIGRNLRSWLMNGIL